MLGEAGQDHAHAYGDQHHRKRLVYLPEKATWLSQHLHELVTFSNGKHDDQAQPTSQVLDWLKNFMWEPAILVHYREKALEQYRNASNVDIPNSDSVLAGVKEGRALGRVDGYVPSAA
jgi:hypothetical protein